MCQAKNGAACYRFFSARSCRAGLSASQPNREPKPCCSHTQTARISFFYTTLFVQPSLPPPPTSTQGQCMGPGESWHHQRAMIPSADSEAFLFCHTTFLLTKGWGGLWGKPPQQLHPSFLLQSFLTNGTFRSPSLQPSLHLRAESRQRVPFETKALGSSITSQIRGDFWAGVLQQPAAIVGHRQWPAMRKLRGLTGGFGLEKAL